MIWTLLPGAVFLADGCLKKKAEEERAEFHKYYTGQVWGCMNHYDLCINAGVLGTERTVELIYSYLKSRGLTDEK